MRNPFAGRHAKPRPPIGRRIAGWTAFTAVTALTTAGVMLATSQPSPPADPTPSPTQVVQLGHALRTPATLTADYPIVVRVPDNGVQATCRPAQVHRRAIIVVIRDSEPVFQFNAVCDPDGPFLFVWDATSSRLRG
jgi:hypothetical protein